MDLNEGSKSCGKLERLLVFLSFLADGKFDNSMGVRKRTN